MCLGLPLTVIAALSAGVSAGATTLWPTYHLDPGRSGNDAGEPSFGSLGSLWDTGALDGAIYAEPLVDGNNVIVATENNSVYAFNVANGSLQWGPVHLGAPRTSNFPCGDINPLGITGTPVIDAGYLYAVAEVQTSSTSWEFRLAKLSTSNGAVTYENKVTPSGMDSNVHQERSALDVSNGNIVVTWGGLDGDCGNYHGYIETVSESTGTEQHQWNDTNESGGREGGMWAPSGPAVDTSGNIYVGTGNGSSSTITNYDYGDSVLKFSPTLSSPSFFAPGAPQSWTSLNANDTDLGSIDPSLLPNGLLFSIGKGGRAYLLSQWSLPNNSNPGGGENHSAQVCNNTSDAAFGGLAVSSSIVYVPCADGIAAVNIDSASAFHRIWYQTSGGGMVWTLSMFGKTLYGLQPGTGAISERLSLPAFTEHFATPAAGDGRLFLGAGNRLATFAPPPSLAGTANPPAAAADSSGHQEVVWKGTDANLWEASWNGSAWSGPAGRGMGPMGSPPAIAIGSTGEVDVFWKGTDSNLWEAIDSGGVWSGPFARGIGPLGSGPTVDAWGSEVDVFWSGTDRQLWEAYVVSSGSWHGPQRIGMGPLGSQPTAAAHASTGEVDVFWSGSDSQLWEGFWNGSQWVGPLYIGMGPLGSRRPRLCCPAARWTFCGAPRRKRMARSMGRVELGRSVVHRDGSARLTSSRGRLGHRD